MLDRIVIILSEGIKSVGFVSPSHVVPQVKAIIRGLRSHGFNPVTVYNTNSYDKPEIIRSLSDMIDVYLPDFKYVTPEIAMKYSGADDYPEIALNAIKEMYFQKGSTLILDDNGMAENGILLRHLVLPGHTEESIKCFTHNCGGIVNRYTLSLMSQYYPTEYCQKPSGSLSLSLH